MTLQFVLFLVYLNIAYPLTRMAIPIPAPFEEVYNV